MEGRNVLTHCKKHNKLNEKKRISLVKLVKTTVINDSDRDLEYYDFEILTKKIIDKFSTEESTVYFTPPVSAKKSVDCKYKKAKGKLFNKYFNLKRILINDESESLPQNNKNVENNKDIIFENLHDIQDSIDWLKEHEEPWDVTERHWILTFEYRTKLKSNSLNDTKVSSIYAEWPILKTPKGFSLIDLEFKLMKVCQQNNPIENFNNIYEKVVEVTNFQFKDEYCQMLISSLEDNDLNDDNILYAKLAIICYAIPSHARISVGKKKYWKPSCIETLEGIVAHVDAS